ncbi:holin class I [Rhizobium phage Palo]|uniref:Holin class I n=1 Tax=Rhizobium phage Palo TaxID=2767573 RepID=A0A7L8G4H3_9CAUD|nr:holin class I [Rhizobium phage Palo]
MFSMMAGLILAGFALTTTFFLVMHRTGALRKFLGYAGLIDIMFTILIFALFAHTFSGVIAGTFAGLFLALGLTLMRNIVGYERLHLRRVKWYKGFIRAEWVYHYPKWKQGYEHGKRSTGTDIA